MSHDYDRRKTAAHSPEEAARAGKEALQALEKLYNELYRALYKHGGAVDDAATFGRLDPKTKKLYEAASARIHAAVHTSSGFYQDYESVGKAAKAG